MASRIEIALALALAALPLPVFAALGGNGATLLADQTQLQADSRTLTAAARNAEVGASGAGATAAALPAAVTVQELTQPDGTVIREYLAHGQVFGIAWNGPTPPNLRQLLGSYFQIYTSGVQAAANQGQEHGPAAVQSSGLVVYSGGHMNAFSGQAFLPQSLPQGVTAQDIQ
jgi:hypothetical protein